MRSGMTDRLVGMATLLVMAMPSCGQQKTSESPEAGWVRDCPSDAFCFSRPPGLVAQPVQAIDSVTGIYRGGGMTLRFDMGANAADGKDLVQAAAQDITVDGKPAQVLTAGPELMLVVPRVHESGRFKVRFAMSLQFEGAAQPALARRIFDTIQFKPPR